MAFILLYQSYLSIRKCAMQGRNHHITKFKIIASYAILGLLGLAFALLMFHRFREYTSNEVLGDGSKKLLTVSNFLSKLYEVENFSKLALRTDQRRDFVLYNKKVDSLLVSVDSLRKSTSATQTQLLDSIATLLKQKVRNSQEIGRLQVVDKKSGSIDSLLADFKRLETSLGRITAEMLAPDFENQPKEQQDLIREYVALLNKNIPEKADTQGSQLELDSVLEQSKAMLKEARNESLKARQRLSRKESELLRADFELSRKLQRIIAALGKETALAREEREAAKQELLQKSIRLVGLILLIGIVIVGLFIFLINRDFWKIQRYRAQLEEEKKYSEFLLKSREQLISTVSHDLRTPLNTIMGYAALLGRQIKNDEESAHLQKIHMATQFINRLVNDLLDFSKLEAGKITLKTEPLQLKELLHETAIECQKQYSKSGIDLKLNVSKALEQPILSDSTRLRQILNNLIGNAFKFTSKGHVHLFADIIKKKKKPYARIRIADTGIGIAKNKQDLIFKEFHKQKPLLKKSMAVMG